MAKIKILPQNLVNLIAAGEVVERPASALKELIENSIDAKATKITINLKDYGNELIEVKDNGVGMDKVDAEMAFKQHATSKITSEEDLIKILSFGFRGEALASISSVAEEIVLESKTEHDNAVKLKISGIKSTFETSTQTDPGTTISIKNIFKNIPARRKFLKSNAVELKHLTETFLNIALNHLKIHFELYHNEKLIYRLTSTSKLEDRIFEIWGKNTVRNLYKSGIYESGGTKLYGLFGSSELGRKGSNHQYIYVNSRYVQSKILGTAVNEAYRGFLHKDLKPAYFIFIEVPPDSIDVNIHPRKTEIRFSDSQSIFRLAYSLARKTLENTSRSIIRDTLSEPGIEQISTLPESFTNTYSEPKATSEPSFTSLAGGNKTYSFKDSTPKFEVQQALTFTRSLIESSENESKQEDILNLQIRTYFQIFNTYIVFERGEKVIFLDQHAAAEKILFEKLYDNLGEVKTKPLLIPEIIELKKNEKEMILEKKEELGNIGIIIEDFGESTIQVIEIPEIIEKINLQNYIEELIQPENDFSKSFDKDKKDYSGLSQEAYMMIATAACHGSIRAGQKLSEPEMISIIQNLSRIKNPYNCPHGRPVMWELTKEEVEKNFKRKL